MLKMIKGFVELIKGMGITGKHLGKHAVTLQYPEEKMEMFERSRGIVVLLSDKETGELNCTGCELCMRACPTAAIRVVAPRDPETKKKTLEAFTVDNALCCYCGLCEEACNFSALKMAPIYYEQSVLEKDTLLWDKDKLQQMGLPVAYEDTRKKKPEKKVEPKPAAPKEETPQADTAPAAEKPAEKTEENKNEGEDK